MVPQFVDPATLPQELASLFAQRAATGPLSASSGFAPPTPQQQQAVYDSWQQNGTPLGPAAMAGGVTKRVALDCLLQCNATGRPVDLQRLWNEVAMEGGTPLSLEEFKAAVANSVAVRPDFNKDGTLRLRTVKDFILGSSTDLAARLGRAEAMGGANLTYSLISIAAHVWAQERRQLPPR